MLHACLQVSCKAYGSANCNDARSYRNSKEQLTASYMCIESFGAATASLCTYILFNAQASKQPVDHLMRNSRRLYRREETDNRSPCPVCSQLKVTHLKDPYGIPVQSKLLLVRPCTHRNVRKRCPNIQVEIKGG